MTCDHKFVGPRRCAKCGVHIDDLRAQLARLRRIHARLTVHDEGYAVHVPCGSEAEPPSAAGARYTCCKCGPVPSDAVAAVGELEEHAAEDIRYLLEMHAGARVTLGDAAEIDAPKTSCDSDRRT